MIKLLPWCVSLGLLAAAPAAHAKDTLTIGVAQFPASLHPYISSQTVQYFTIGFATRPVSSYDTKGERICLLCAELPTLDNHLAVVEDLPGGGKGLAVTIKLKPGLKWSDGVPVTSKDIEFTWRLAKSPDAGFVPTYNWNRATRLDIVDDSTVVLHLDKTYVTFNLWDYLLPEHIEAKFATGTGPAGAMDYINKTLYNAAPTTPGLWNGPYVVSNYNSGNSIELTPNPYWSGPAPEIKHVIVRLIDNTAALQANLLSGDVDFTPSGIGITTDQAVALERDTKGKFQFFYHTGLQLERIDMAQDGPLSDLKVRQALLMGIDRKTLIDKLFSGHAVLANAWINDVEKFYTTDVQQYPYDPARARALLAEAGFKPGADGIAVNAAGQKLSFDFATTSGNRIRELSQQVFQNQWKAIGVEVHITNQPSRTFFGEYMRKRAYQGLAEYANSGRIGVPPTTYYASVNIPTQANNYTGQNLAGTNIPALDAAMAEAETELDPEKQQELWVAMQKLYAANLPELPLYFRQDPDIVPASLRGYEATGKEDYTSYFAENWRY